ncbi:hypothetical protein [Actinophytocola sp.]|uniref:hypothetical protein n=1 Tax=Actinophytocola sp. TaxID=1872138 RepID=UPI003D6B63C6
MTTEVIKEIEDYFLGRADSEPWAPDVVVEVPFARPGQPRRFEGRRSSWPRRA